MCMTYPFISSSGCSDVIYSIVWSFRQIVHFHAASPDRSTDRNMLPYCIYSNRFTLLLAVHAGRRVSLVNHYQFQHTVSINSGRNTTPLFFFNPNILLTSLFSEAAGLGEKNKKINLWILLFCPFLACDLNLAPYFFFIWWGINKGNLNLNLNIRCESNM